MDNTTDEVFVLVNQIQVGDAPGAEDFMTLEVFGNQAEADYAHTIMLANSLTPYGFRQDRAEFEAELPEALETTALRPFVIRWDLPGHPGEAEMTDHLDHLDVPIIEPNPGWAYV